MTQQRTDSRKTRELATAALLTSLSLIFSYVEFLIPFNIGMPGIKLGLANIVVVICIYRISPRWGIVINIARICLSALLFGSVFSAVYSLAGGLVSLLCMILLKKSGIFSVTGVSMAGGFAHNMGQMLAAMALMQTKEIILYFPVLTLSGMLTGIINGIIAVFVLKSLTKQKI